MNRQRERMVSVNVLLLLVIYLIPRVVAFHDPSAVCSSKETRRNIGGGTSTTAASTTSTTTTPPTATTTTTSTLHSNRISTPDNNNSTLASTGFTTTTTTTRKKTHQEVSSGTKKQTLEDPKQKKNKKKESLSLEGKQQQQQPSKKQNKNSNTHKSKKHVITSEEATSLRRIQSEWKDMVEAGMAFNWKTQRPVLAKGVEHHTPHHLWVGPLSKNLWVWHFSFMGIEGTAFEGGIYHGRLILPHNYPGSPPKVQVFTRSGRFVPGADICLSASHFHPETWTATWTVRTLIESLRLHMLTTANEIGGLEASREQRVALAKSSRKWKATLSQSSSIFVDHASMIEDGLFPDFQYEEEERPDSDEKDTNEPSCNNPQIHPRVELVQHHERQGVVMGMFGSPLKVALLGLCLLFVILNTR